MATHLSTIPLVDLKAQYQPIKAEIDAALHGVLDSAAFILGPDVKAFEEEYAAFSQTRYALGISNGLDALRIALTTLGIGPGDEVISPANSYIATALAISGVGATPIFVDCERDTYEIDTEAVESAISSRTKAIIPVHLMGLSADMERVNAIAAKHKLFVIEDAAQSQGSTFKGKPCGSLSTIACTSFFPGKNLGGYGDGGAVMTNDDQLLKRMEQLRNYGQAEKYHHVVQGLNCRLDTLQAAILRVKLRHLPAWNAARRSHAATIIKQLSGVGDVKFQRVPSECIPNYHLFIIETTRRDALKDHLAERGIMCGIHYPIPIPRQKAYAELGINEGAFPHSEYLAKHMLTLPMYAELTTEHIERICEGVRSFFS